MRGRPYRETRKHAKEIAVEITKTWLGKKQNLFKLLVVFFAVIFICPIFASADEGDAIEEGSDNIRLEYLGIERDVSGTTAKYQIIVNSDGIDLDENDNSLRVVNSLGENLRMDFSSITFDSSDCTFAVKGTNVEFRIPDGLAVIITYETKVIGDGELELINRCSLGKEIAISEENISMEPDLSAENPNYNLHVMKIDGDTGVVLSGAKFDLYMLEDDEIEEDGVLISKALCTNANGILYVESEEVENLGDNTFYLQETEAPDGYECSEERFYFRLSTTEADEDNYLYVNGSTMIVENKVLTEEPEAEDEKDENEQEDNLESEDTQESTDTPENLSGSSESEGNESPEESSPSEESEQPSESETPESDSSEPEESKPVESESKEPETEESKEPESSETPEENTGVIESNPPEDNDTALPSTSLEVTTAPKTGTTNTPMQGIAMVIIVLIGLLLVKRSSRW